jgi:putative hydrolase of the HAD superfamily
VNYSRQLLEKVAVKDNLQERAQLVREWFDSEYVPAVGLASGATELLAQLKRDGYILGVISNRSQPFHEVLERLEIADWFDIILAAGEIGCWKPNVGIFDHARSHFVDLAAAECVYVGDNYYADGIGASKAGMTPIIFDPEGLYDDMSFPCIAELEDVTAVLQNAVNVG